MQVPAVDMRFFDRVYRGLRGTLPHTLREDFCGTGLLAASWVRRRPGNRAWGIDLDPVPLAWGERHNRAPLGAMASRLHLVRGDVRTTRIPPCDVAAAMNFSFNCFKERDELVAYFATVRRSLRKAGVLFLDAFGGPESMEILSEKRRMRGFTYVWEQSDYDPISGHIMAHITFRFPDGTAMRRAFTYDWRAWTVPELRDCLREAGFAATRVFWETTDARGSGTGVFREARRATPCESFVCCIAAHGPE